MDVTRDDVLRCARLAHLRLEEGEVEPLRKDMEALLNHAASLDRLDLAGIEPAGHPLGLAAPRRADEPMESLSQAEALGNAPRHDAAHFLVPKVL